MEHHPQQVLFKQNCQKLEEEVVCHSLCEVVENHDDIQKVEEELLHLMVMEMVEEVANLPPEEVVVVMMVMMKMEMDEMALLHPQIIGTHSTTGAIEIDQYM